MPARRHFGFVRNSRPAAIKPATGTKPSATWRPRPSLCGDAQAVLSAMEADIRRGVWIDPAVGKITLAKWVDHWLRSRTDLRPVTRAKYRHMLDRHVLPVLGGQELAKLRPSAVRSWYMGMRGRYKTTADDAYRMLRAILTTAVTDGLVPKNPCQVKGAGQSRSAERPTASVAEVAAAAEATPEHHRLAVLLPAWCQLRRGEVLGLQRRDIDLLHGTIRVDRSVVRPMSGDLGIGPPKTSAGRRSIAVPSNILPAVRDHLERFVGPEPADWLFTSESGGPMLPSTLNRIWQRARKSIGRTDLFLHYLRHSGLTWAAGSGASSAELMRRGGYANPTAALRYQHATEDRDRAIADALADLAAGTVMPLRTAPDPVARTRSRKA